MTDKEKAIVMAYTGIAMLTGDKFDIFHKYVEEIMCRPVFTHEFAICAEEIKEKAKPDCRSALTKVSENDFCSKAIRREEKICPAYSDDEVKQPCVNCLECEIIENGKCAVCGKPLEEDRLFICKECQKKEGESN